LWVTSDTDHFHMSSKIINSKAVIKKIFEDRQHWLRYVANALYLEDKKISKFPEQPCQFHIQSLSLNWLHLGQDSRKERVLVLFSSFNSLTLKFTNHSSVLPNIGEIVHLESDEPIMPEPAAFIIGDLKKRSLNNFHVWEIDDQQRIIKLGIP